MPEQIKFGVFLPFYAFKSKNDSQIFNQLQDVALKCEQLEFSSIWLDDHLMLNKKPIYECWTTLSALAKVTKKIRLGTMVACNSFRNPALLAKMGATVDNISNGRLELGLGAGIQKREHWAYGFTFNSPKIRIQRLEEAVKIIKKLWTQNNVYFKGKHYKIRNANCEPKPLQKPHPPLIIGGGGEQLMLKLSAKYADRFDWGYLSSPELYHRKLEILRRYCKRIGRAFNEIEKSCWPIGQIYIGTERKFLEENFSHSVSKDFFKDHIMHENFVYTPQDFLEQIQYYTNFGVTYFMLFFSDVSNFESLTLFAKEVIQKIK
ncbi:TIGR03560 family F420-dependent LLM class oxidoreductase [Candidatus Bathyarchaeota archaeon]|nr:TIGR03560 family F420-dependent LLM class oxidoreductase [Candidatus Bathyarchaeota archaeon]